MTAWSIRRFLGLMIFANIASTALAEPFYFSWGHVHRNGFAFVGKPEVMRNDCLNWMVLKRISFASEVSIRGSDRSLPASTPASTLCQLIYQNAESLGASEKQRVISGTLNGDEFFFVGKPSGIVTACKNYLASRRIVSTGRLEFHNGTSYGRVTLNGDEICGVIANQAAPIGHPYDLYIVSGTMQGFPFAWFGNPEKIIDSCQAFLTRNAIRVLSRLELSNGPVRFPSQVSEQRICGEVLANAQLMADARRVFTFKGQINRSDVWFVGKPDKFLTACVDWATRNRIGRITSLLDSVGQSLPILAALEGEGICGALINQAQPMVGSINWYLVAGKIAAAPFVWAGSVELVANQCHAYLLRHHIQNASQIMIDGTIHRFDRPQVGSTLCFQILQLATPLQAPHPVYDAAGKLNDENFWFHGRVEEFTRQCLQFAIDRRFVSIGSATINDTPWPLPTAEPPELVCRALLDRAATSSEPSFSFQAGQIKGQGFAFFGRNTDVLSECETRLVQLSITSGDKFVLHDQEFLRDSQWTSARSLCDEFEKKGVSYVTIPEVHVEASVLGQPFTVQAQLDEAMQQCLAFVVSHDIGEVTTVIVNNQTLTAPFNAWLGQEVCGVVLRAALN